jgi:hypothetical protein
LKNKLHTHGAAALLALAFLLGTGGNPASAESQAASADMARPEEMPYLTLVDPFTLYSGPETRPDQAVGALSPLQSVQMLPIERNELLNISTMARVEVGTWLGPVWINLKEGAYLFNKLEVKEEVLTLLEKETVLYEAPGRPSPYTLAPQKVQAIASVDAHKPYTPLYNEDYYYLIHTSWLGDMWINPQHYAEKYKPLQATGAIAISSERSVYLYPNEPPLENEAKVQPQVVMPLAKYTQKGRLATPVLWYKIGTPLGDRWILQESRDGWEGMKESKETIRMPVPFTYYTSFYSKESNAPKQPPQDLQAIDKLGDWVMVLVNGEGRWVNPSLEIALSLTGDMEHDRTLGVKEYTTPIEISEWTVTADYPSPGALKNDQELLVFTRQQVTPERVWDSPNGTRWYYISTWRGPKWAMNP